MLGLGLRITNIINFASDFVKLIINTFKARVSADAGTFEAESCLNTTISNLRNLGLYDSASLILTPNAEKVSKVYSLKPIDGSGDLTFSRNCVALRRNSSLVWEQVAANIPRIHYPLSGCPSWLMELSRTNLFATSSNFSRVTPEQITITANNALGPKGANTGTTILEAASDGVHHFLNSTNTFISGTAYTQSMRVKPNGREWCLLRFHDTGGVFTDSYGYFHLSGAGSLGTVDAGITASIELDSEGYYFIQASRVAAATAAGLLIFGIAESDGDRLYLGDITKGVYVWNYQVGTGVHASSPIVTSGATVTRLADAVSSLTGISALLGQVSGALFWEASFTSGELGCDFSLTDGTSDNRVILRVQATQEILLFVQSGGAVQASITSSAISLNTTYKACAVYSNNYFALFVNGVKIGEDLSGVVPVSLDRISPGDINAKLKPLIVFPSIISDAQAIALTT